MCPAMSPPRQTELSQQPPTLGTRPARARVSLPLRLPHPQFHTEDSRARISPEPPPICDFKRPQKFSQMSPIPTLSSPFFSLVLPRLVRPCRSSWGLNPQTLLQDLMADLKSELSGSLAKLILGLMLTPAQYDAKQLRKAVEVIVTLLVLVAGQENEMVLAVAVPTLLVAQGCECPHV